MGRIDSAVSTERQSEKFFDMGMDRDLVICPTGQITGGALHVMAGPDPPAGRKPLRRGEGLVIHDFLSQK
jgi:hypothetical protein